MENINFELPTCWGELSQDELRWVYVRMARYSGTGEHAWLSVASEFALKRGRITVLSPYGRNWLIRYKGKKQVMDREEFTAVCRSLEWLSGIPEIPLRLDHIDEAQAVDADVIDVLPFSSWLTLENYWQGYNSTRDESLLREMARILYPDLPDGRRLSPAEKINIFYWWAAVKERVARMFPHFYRSTGENADTPDPDTIRRAIDAQIRALTKVDITKEGQVLEMTAARALTELDAQAREYEELNRKYPKK